MEFFCAKCKKKYDASLIGFNFSDPWHEEIAQGVEAVLSDDYVDSAEKLAKFCRDRVNGGKDFVFSGKEIPGMMRGKTGNDELIMGYFTLTLGWLCEKYEHYYGKEIDIDEMLFDEPVFSKYIKVSYDIIEDQPVLYCIKDENDDPLTEVIKQAEKEQEPGKEQTSENGQLHKKQEGRKYGFVRCCPENHTLSQAVGKAKEYVIALAGGERAGKTSCLTAMAHALRDGIYHSKFELSMDYFPDDDSWKKRMEKDLADYRQGYQILKTDSQGDYTLNYSLLVKVGNAKRVLTFVDMPGELWTRKDGMGFSQAWYTEYEGIYKNLDCIWFFISKWTAYNVTTMEAEQLEELVLNTDESKEIVERGNAANLRSNLSELATALQRSGKNMPPVAVILTKSDLDITGNNDHSDTKQYNLFPVDEITNQLAEVSQIPSKNSKETGRILENSRIHKSLVFKEQEYWHTANLVRAFFMKRQEGAICSAIEESCPNRTYIAMAAYGHRAEKVPEEKNKANNENISNLASTPITEKLQAEVPKPVPPTPYHEMFPLLWTFAILGALPIEHPCEWYRENWLKKMRLDAAENVVIPFSYRALQRVNEKIRRRQAEGEKNWKRFTREFDFDTYLIMTDIETNMMLKEAKKPKFAVTQFAHRKG